MYKLCLILVFQHFLYYSSSTLSEINIFSKNDSKILYATQNADSFILWIQSNSQNNQSSELLSFHFNVQSLQFQEQQNLKQVGSLLYSSIKYKEGKLPYSSCYLMEGTVGQVECYDSNFTRIETDWDYTFQSSQFKIEFLGSYDEYFYTLKEADGLYFGYKKWNNDRFQLISTYNPGHLYTVKNIFFYSPLVYVLYYDTLDMSKCYVSIFGSQVISNTTYYEIRKILEFSISDTNNLKLVSNSDYLILFSGKQIFIRNMSQVEAKFKNFVLETIIQDVEITQFYLLVSIGSEIRQYSVPDFTLISQISTIQPNLKILYAESLSLVLGFQPGSSAGYIFNLSNAQQPYQANQVSNSQQQLKILMPQFFKSCYSIQPQYLYCESFCYYSCSKCDSSPTDCTQCKTGFQLTQNNQCVMPSSVKVMAFAGSVTSTFRIQTIQYFSYASNSLDLYKYHKTDYTGSFKTALQYIQIVQDNIWNMLPFEQLQNWVDAPIPFPTYIPFTNQKFVSIQRSDSIFLQNTKSFFVIFTPISVITFIIVNKIFYSLFNYQISSFLRIYSFWIQLKVIIVLQNLNILVVYTLVHLSNLFSLNPSLYFCNWLIISTIGLIFVFAICWLPMTIYFYGKLSKYFLFNLHFQKVSFVVMFIRFIIKPILQSVINILLYQHPSAQLVLLSILSFTVLVFIIFIEGKYSVFKLKGLFWIQFVLQTIVITLNMLNYLKYYTEASQIVSEIAEDQIDGWLKTYIGMSVLILIYGPFQWILSVIMCRKAESIQQNHKTQKENQSETKVRTIVKKEKTQVYKIEILNQEVQKNLRVIKRASQQISVELFK